MPTGIPHFAWILAFGTGLDNKRVFSRNLVPRYRGAIVTRTFAVPSIGFLVGVSATATFASIGIAYLLFNSLSLPVASVTVPIGAVLLTGMMVVAAPRRGEDAQPNRSRGPIKIDTTTGLANPIFAEQFVTTEFAAAQRGRAMTVVTMRITDYDRLAGDEASQEVLVAVSRVLRRCTRAMNVTAHDENQPGTFLSVLSDVDASGACVFVQRVRKELAAIQMFDRPVTISAGVAGYDYSMRAPGELIGASRMALERAARDGGSRVVLAAAGVGGPVRPGLN